MKEMWEAPRILVEEFAPNEYVSVCYQVGCGNTTGAGTLPGRVDEAGNLTGEYYTKTDLWGEYGQDPNLLGNISVKGNTYRVRNEHDGACKDPNKNAIQVNGKEISIWEDSGWGGTLESEITYKVDYNKDGKIGAGDLFAWVTFKDFGSILNDANIWLHWAIAGLCDENHPNRS